LFTIYIDGDVTLISYLLVCVNGVPVSWQDPASWDGEPIWPGQYHNPVPDTRDPTRVSVEDAGTDVEFGPNDGITVTPIGRYYSRLGYTHRY
jgi:hypothetical protein